MVSIFRGSGSNGGNEASTENRGEAPEVFHVVSDIGSGVELPEHELFAPMPPNPMYPTEGYNPLEDPKEPLQPLFIIGNWLFASNDDVQSLLGDLRILAGIKLPATWAQDQLTTIKWRLAYTSHDGDSTTESRQAGKSGADLANRVAECVVAIQDGIHRIQMELKDSAADMTVLDPLLLSITGILDEMVARIPPSFVDMCRDQLQQQNANTHASQPSEMPQEDLESIVNAEDHTVQGDGDTPQVAIAPTAGKESKTEKLSLAQASSSPESEASEAAPAEQGDDDASEWMYPEEGSNTLFTTLMIPIHLIEKWLDKSNEEMGDLVQAATGASDTNIGRSSLRRGILQISIVQG